MRFATLFLVLSLLQACGKMECDKEGESCNSSTANVGDEVEFTGYVQRAFALTVNGVSFSDSEDFYTRFIPELIKSKDEYKDRFLGSTITVQGEYGLERFGANNSVFMASDASEGHLFQGRTDMQGKFTIKVKKNAQDEIYKARIVMRIGLSVTNADSSAENYCYLLHGIRDSISIDGNTKPIIWDEFSTQLNSYRCEDVKEERLIIPEANGGLSTEIPVDDGGAVTNPDGSSASTKAIKFKNTVSLSIPLIANESGENSVSAISSNTATGEIFVFKGKVTAKDDGRQYYPLVTLSGVNNPSRSQIEIKPKSGSTSMGQSDVGVADQLQVRSVVVVGEHIYIGAKANSGVLVNGGTMFVSDTVGIVLDPDSTVRMYVANGGGFSFLQGESDGWDIANGINPVSICNFDIDTGNANVCWTEPASNPKETTTFNVGSVVRVGTKIYAYAGNRINEYNSKLVFQRSYSVSPLLFAASDKGITLLAIGDVFYLANMRGDNLLMRELELPE